MLKRMGDFLSNLAVASLAIGLYKEGDPRAVVAGIFLFALCLILAKMEGKK